MRPVIVSLLSILLLSACTTTKTIVDYQTVIKSPANILMTPCIIPFNTRPKTYGEAVERDQVWYDHFNRCAKQVDGIRAFYRVQENATSQTK